ncbi:MAG: type IV secretion system DNA-binding domain-containing protein [Candidatus Gracilibacteria bacterium]|nr:type IV secretion system DNA-binding domain-containing protein [Candidatus Gracilibacteria bacterium]
MEKFLYIIPFVFIISGVYFFYLKKKSELRQTLNLAFYKIIVPKKDSDLDDKKETSRDFKEAVSIMEQLLSSLKSIQSSKIYKKLLGQDLISLEYVAIKDEISFYIVAPKEYKELLEKQINGFYPDAIVEETLEENIFLNKKYNVSTYLFTKRSFCYPIKTYQKLESDPINNITNALSKLDEDEAAIIQILLKPIDDDWQKESFKFSSKILQGKKEDASLGLGSLIKGFVDIILMNKNDGDNGKGGGNSTSALTQERAKTVDEKGDKTGYEVNIRIITTGNNRSSVNSNLTNIVSSFSQFSYPEFNKFGSTYKHSHNRLVNNYIYRIFSKPFMKDKMILNTEEIASLFHFPHSKYNKTPEIKWQNFKIVKAPSNIPKEGLLLGYNIHRGSKKEIRVKTEDRFRHFYVIGQTGTGKSSIIQVMARQDLRNGNGLAVMDPHGDLAKDLLPFIPRERADDVIYFDPADESRPMGLNILEATTPDEKEKVAQDAMNIMIKLFGSEIFGPRIQDYFRNGCLTLMDYPQGGAITDIIRIFTDNDFQKDRIRTLKNPIVRNWWEKTYAAMGEREKGEIIPYFAAKFGQFITNSMMRNILGQLKSSFDVSDVMQKGNILMINLSKGLIGDLNSELLGLIIVNKIQMAAMRRQQMSKEDRKDFFLYIDEFQNYITPSIESILSEARKYRLGLILAHQYLGQLEKSDALTKSSLNLKNAIFGNVGSVLSYKVGPEDGEFLAKYYAPTFSEQDLVNMDKFKAVMKLSIDQQPSTPFSIIPVNPYLETGDTNIAKAFVELSRLKYGRDKEFVGKEIEYRIGSM